ASTAQEPEPETPTSPTTGATSGTVATTGSTAAPAATIRTTTTPATTTSTIGSAPVEVDLVIGGAGSTSSRSSLPLATSAAAGPLPNYDSDRDDQPGLLLGKGAGLGETDQTKMQRWRSGTNLTGSVEGTPIVEIWAATKDFDTGKSGRLVAGIYDCNTALSDCGLLASGGATFRQASFGSEFGRVSIEMSPVATELGQGRALMLKIAVADSSDDDLWLAFGVTRYPASVRVS
ncbi:MAG: hypothetical protein ACR2QK_16145, partial [Acidimicrobiales bacterium]